MPALLLALVTAALLAGCFTEHQLDRHPLGCPAGSTPKECKSAVLAPAQPAAPSR